LSRSYQQGSGADATSLAADPENRLLSRQNRKRLEYEAILDSILYSSGQLELGNRPESRRRLFAPVTRGRADATRVMFDGPDPWAILPGRATTTTTPQALYFMNDKLVFDAAGRLAERLQKQVSLTEQTRVAHAYLCLLGRPPSG